MKTRICAVFLFGIFIAASVLAATPVGSVIAIEGKASATGEDGSARTLALKAPIFLNDKIATEDNTKIQIMFDDDSVISQGAKSQMTIDEYVYHPDKANEAGSSFKFMQGVFRMVTGKITEINPDRFRVRTKMATIGIRGTELGFRITPKNENFYVLNLGEGHSVQIERTAPRVMGLPAKTEVWDVREAGVVVLIVEGKDVKERPITREEARQIIEESTPEAGEKEKEGGKEEVKEEDKDKGEDKEEAKDEDKDKGEDKDEVKKEDKSKDEDKGKDDKDKKDKGGEGGEEKPKADHPEDKGGDDVEEKPKPDHPTATATATATPTKPTTEPTKPTVHPTKPPPTATPTRSPWTYPTIPPPTQTPFIPTPTPLITPTPTPMATEKSTPTPTAVPALSPDEIRQNEIIDAKNASNWTKLKLLFSGATFDQKRDIVNWGVEYWVRQNNPDTAELSWLLEQNLTSDQRSNVQSLLDSINHAKAVQSAIDNRDGEDMLSLLNDSGTTETQKANIRSRLNNYRSGTDWQWGIWDEDMNGVMNGVFDNVKFEKKTAASLLSPSAFETIRTGSKLYNLSGIGDAAAFINHSGGNKFVQGIGNPSYRPSGAGQGAVLNVQVGQSVVPTWTGTFDMGNRGGDKLNFGAQGAIQSGGQLKGNQTTYSLSVNGTDFARHTITSERIEGNLLGPGTELAPITGAIGEFHFEHGGAATVHGGFGADLHE